jgi:hypothetical protein
MTVVGFSAQFIGLRAMQWSIALMQLGATFTATGLRSWARRGMTRRPQVIPLEANWEAVDLALHILSCDKWQILTGEVAGEIWWNDTSPLATEPPASRGNEASASPILDLYRNADRSMEPSTTKSTRRFARGQAGFGDGSKTPRNLGHRTMELHRRLQKIFPGDNEVETVTSNTCEAIIKICALVSSSEDVVLADLNTVGQPEDPYVRPLFDVLITARRPSEITPGLIQLGLAVKLTGETEAKVLNSDTRKRIRSIISLTYRSLLGNKDNTSQHSIYQPQNYFMRIIGYQDLRKQNRNSREDTQSSYDPLELSEFIWKWVNAERTFPGYHKIPCPDGTKSMIAIDASVSHSPIFGMRFSSLYRYVFELSLSAHDQRAKLTLSTPSGSPI